MEDLNPITLFAIMQESLDGWFWPFTLVSLAVLAAALSGLLKLRNAKRSARKPLLAALVMGGAATALAFALAPGWSHARIAAFNGAIDYLGAFALALVPGSLVAGVIFSIASRRCATRPVKS